ncbi:MAG: hypothetical protein AAB875_05245, partial [Patescibacteria group bacterium]
LEETTRKEKIQSILKERNDILDNNRKLFARAKEAEGFKQDDDGTWIKTVEKPKAEKKPAKSDEDLLQRLDRLALKGAGIVEKEETELVERWKTDTGRTIDDITENSIFKKELEELRTSKANQAATSNIKGEPGDAGIKNTPDYWIAKMTKGSDGKPMFPEELPADMKLRAAIVDKLSDTHSQKDFKFYNSPD